MRKNLKLCLLLNIVLVCACLAGCGMKQEEEVKNQITIPAYEYTAPDTAFVKRGDLEHTERMFVQMEAAEEHALFFGVSGVSYDKVLVREGDLVTKGQLLAQLSCGEIQESIITLEAKAKSIELEILHTQEQLEKVKEEKSMDPEKEEINLDEISRYTMRLTELANDETVNEAAMKEQEEKLAKYRIYADMSGVVTKVGDYSGQAVSDEKQAFIMIAGAEKIYAGSTGKENSFATGNEVTIAVEEENYPAMITSVATEGGTTRITACLKETVMLPLETTFGEITWSSGIVSDVLYLPKEAIVTVKEETYVYRMAEDGFADIVKVQTGVQTDKYVQIVSGIEEGAEVVLY